METRARACVCNAFVSQWPQPEEVDETPLTRAKMMITRAFTISACRHKVLLEALEYLPREGEGNSRHVRECMREAVVECKRVRVLVLESRGISEKARHTPARDGVVMPSNACANVLRTPPAETNSAASVIGFRGLKDTDWRAACRL